MSYIVAYEAEELGTQVIVSKQDVTIAEAFDIAANEAAIAFFANGGDSYDCTDLNYTVQPEA